MRNAAFGDAPAFASALPDLQREFVAAYNDRNLDKVVDFYLPEASLLLADRTLLRNQASIRQYHGEHMAAGQRFVSFNTVALVTEDARAIEVADVTVELPAGDSASVSRTARVIAIWRKQADGTWKLDADIFA